MPTIEEILRAAKEAGASDVHLTVGIPPKMRVNGNLITMDYPRMLPADTLEVLVNIMTEVQRERFEERGEYDMSFSIPNCGRYRVNAYKQRGSVALAFRKSWVYRNPWWNYISANVVWYWSPDLPEAVNPRRLPPSSTRSTTTEMPMSSLWRTLSSICISIRCPWSTSVRSA